MGSLALVLGRSQQQEAPAAPSSSAANGEGGAGQAGLQETTGMPHDMRTQARLREAWSADAR